jgi:HSP20 family protein
MNTAVENQAQGQLRRQGDDRFVIPPANISANENEYLVEVEMPGVDKSGLEITVEGSELTITGRRKTEVPQGELCYCESALANFRRMFELGPDVDTSKIQAQMEQGVLKLRLPKSEKAKPRKITING